MGLSDGSGTSAAAAECTAVSSAAQDPVAIPESELLSLYDSYRVRQARALLSLMPREAVRPMYRRALTDSAEGDADPMDRLVAYAETLLPLPTFQVWLEDLRHNPDAHWRDLEGSADVPSSSAPATVDTRRLRVRTRGWNAHLRGFRDSDVWRGFIAFEDVGVAPPSVHHTALIFCEDSVEALRERFRAFESPALEAFLRSSLP